MTHGEGGGRPPYGWTATGGGTPAFAPVATEMIVLTRIRELRGADYTYQAIADDLNGRGFRTRINKEWDRFRVKAALHTIKRFGIPEDIDAAIKTAHAIAAKKKGRDYRIRKPGDFPPTLAM